MLAIGLMSGTSLDGIDAALLDTDGEGLVRPRGFVGLPYSDADRATLAAATELALLFDDPGEHPLIARAEELLTRTHAAAVAALLAETGVSARAVDVIGFHGQTVAHRPDKGWTWQLGDGAALAAATGIDVVAELRIADVAAGGQGAPLLPVYHAALAGEMARPIAVLNLGGVGNITFIGGDGLPIAFDTGPANGLIDSWVEAELGARFDADGALAASGRVDEAVLTAMLDHPFFDLAPPKSLDRHDFTIQPARGLSAADGAATLTAFTAACVAEAIDRCPERPRRLIVAGGGRRNPTMLAMIAARTGLTPELSDALGWNGDALEAEGFAYLAVRSRNGLPISFPGTTGVDRPLTGGTLYRAPRGGLALRVVGG
ncbi:anhydro-N-acetylmuramic acid kinase [Sphingomonas sp. VNH70]|uniref:anhydro-N-acetylmuramic acid kinase n=1 Tax=Sphingomonas silueang TaxID=3156617 RepID=UPI0032B40A0E